MKRICKQCGKTFELSDSEIAFYQKKNLHLPKRCKECRQADKQGESAREKRNGNEKKQNRNVPEQNDNKGGKWVYGLIVVVLLLLFGLTRVSNPKLPPAEDGVSVSVENKNGDTDITVGNEKSDTEESGVIQDGENDSPVSLQPEADSVPEQQSEPYAESTYTFRSSKLLNEHFEKHGKEMGFSSAEEYLAAANAVVNHADALHKTEKEDGDDVYYLEETNEFVIVSTDGFIRTYFYPDAGIDYYNGQ